MTSFDANILLYAFSRASPFHETARRFLEDLTPDDNVAVSELVLVEFYTLLRNPAVLARPLQAAAAVEVVQEYRRHPRWMLLGFDPDSPALHGELWPLAARRSFARRRIYDARLALTLRRQGVTEFATANLKDFRGFGFDRVWNPVG
ncbi:MAG: PIN domain-containing protein [Acidobacteria bacterium]|nr:PIN domain-containing protein [Acidobacteriota bacterium]